MLTNIIIVSVVALTLGISATILVRNARTARLARFELREVLAIEELHRGHFADLPRQTVIECLTKISRITGIDVGRLRPADRFKGELELPHGHFIAGEWDDVKDDIAEKRWKEESKHSIETVRDYIELMAQNG